jgi:hypothetical protein
MTPAKGYRADETRNVDLPNHPRDEFEDILGAYEGEFPATYTYRRRAPLDIDATEAIVESRSVQAGDMPAQAWIDLSGDHATVRLHAHLYADAPADDLRDEAQRILEAWAVDMRRDLSLDSPSHRRVEPESRPGQPPAVSADDQTGEYADEHVGDQTGEQNNA